MNKNIDYWERILKNPSLAYKELFEAEKNFLSNHIPNNSKVLDVGCGEGRNIQTILKITDNVIGIDKDPKAVCDAKENLLNFPSVKILLGDVLSMPFPKNTFDVITLTVTLVNFNDFKVAALKEMCRVLKNDGKIIVSVYSENALAQRTEQYKQVGAVIKNIDGQKLFFDLPVDVVSEQFSKEEIEELADQANLKLSICEKVGNLAYICELMKK